MSPVIHPDRFHYPRPKQPRDHRGTLLTPVFFVGGWAILVGLYHITVFITAHVMGLIAP